MTTTQWGTVPAKTEPREQNIPAARPALPAWSYSRLAKWEQCPLSAYFAFVLKVPEPKSEQMLRGQRAHEDAAKVLTRKPIDIATTPLSAPWIKRLDNTRATYGDDIEVELQQGFDKGWAPIGWFDKATWLRVVFDAMIVKAGTDTVLVEEHKTGKPRAEHLSQATLYAAGAYALVPGAATYEITLNYLDLDPTGVRGVVRHSFPREQARRQIAVWTERAAHMLEDREYPPNPGVYCKWCAFRKSNKGPCSEG